MSCAGALGSHLATGDEGERRVPERAFAMIASDGSLLALSAGGDLAAFGQLVDRHQSTVLAVARRMLAGHRQEADDVAQEALLRLWRSAGQLDVGIAGAGPWLLRVVSNLCIDRLRLQGRLPPMDENFHEALEAPVQLSTLTQRETAQRIEAAVQALPDRQRVALALFHYDDLSLADIAAKLALSVDAVESLLARARRTLKKELEAEWRGLLEDTL